MQIKSITDLKYLIIKTEDQRVKVMELLERKFGEKEVRKAILSGKFIIFTEEQIRNDF